MQQASGQNIPIDQALQTSMQQINAGQLGAAQSQILNLKPSQPDAHVPTKSKQPRIAIAFDVVPVK